MKNRAHGPKRKERWWLFFLAFFIFIIDAILLILNDFQFSLIVVAIYLVHKSNVVTISIIKNMIPRVTLVIFGIILFGLRYTPFGETNLAPLDGLFIALTGFIFSIRLLRNK